MILAKESDTIGLGSGKKPLVWLDCVGQGPNLQIKAELTPLR